MAVVAESASPVPAVTSDTDELHARILEHAKFFDSLLELIPAKHYLPKEITVENWVPKFGRNKQNAAPKQKFKEESRKAKRAKLDPASASVTIADLQKQRSEEEKKRLMQDDDSSDRSHPMAEDQPVKGGKKELKGKKRKGENGGVGDRSSANEKIIKEKKKGKEERNGHKSKKENGEQSEKETTAGKKKIENGGPEKSTKSRPIPKRVENGVAANGGSVPSPKKRKVDDPHRNVLPKDGTGQSPSAATGPSPKKSASSKVAPLVAADANVIFSKVEFTTGKPLPTMLLENERLKNRQSKVKLLKKATKEREKVEKSRGTEEGQAYLVEKAYEKSLARAAGVKVKDDPKLIKKSLKKEQKKRVKSAIEWKERKKDQEEGKRQRQERRQKNIQGKMDEKKNNRIEKRKKKLRS
eukprot:CAMPEP_0184336692 /NCGR_PEP_ID=MMETSP1089-20130417/4877_1 /TAXON_ID=38269 ORGANISM="Gloeochaete wittrockiana, Strain SAG46.84" /NCGR_SAMPLE_ID=MMETSP1089 /ASSEMBLY_ACC=CAM_ASM_000445 /LENGTH=411 /DNA_ID=CAMNT_0026661745 /DNA_START=31 /DNA_END=1266 /DNA_ORIENTATION=+